LEILEKNPSPQQIIPHLEERLLDLSENIQRVGESIETRALEADKKWQASLRKTNKIVNNLSRKTAEADNQLNGLSAAREATARSLADLSAQVLDLRESIRVMKPIDCHFSGRSFSGMISHLAATAHENVHVANVVKITASSSDHNEPHHVADMAWDGVWFSEDRPDQWLMYDFGPIRVNVDHYTIKTHKYPSGTCHIKAWVVEGSRDGEHWSELDRRSISLLNGPNRARRAGSFDCGRPG
jgi:hypothetical protein